MSVGQISTMIVATGVDMMGLGCWAWMYMGGGGKMTRVLVAYQPCQSHRNTGRDTVWDQHLRYFEARGNTNSPILNFHDDLVGLLTKWKNAGDEIVIMGDFKEDVYNSILSARLASVPLCLCKLCKHTTGKLPPPTHNQGSIPIDGIFGTVGVESTAATLLPFGAGVGDH